MREWSKLILILIKLQDGKLCQSLLRNTKNLLPTKETIDLVKVFGWDQLKNDLNLTPVTLEKMLKNCNLVNVRFYISLVV